MVINIDEDLANADWTRQTWDLPLQRPEFERWWRRQAMTAAHFRTLPAYAAQDKPPWVDAVLDKLG